MNEEVKGETRPCGTGVCPFTLLPADALGRLLKRPFRKRHPVIFWTGLLLLAGIVIGSISSAVDNDESEDSIALISITGPILNVEPQLEWIRSVADNPRAKGVLLRVDSPGGGASASQELYAALLELAHKKPIAVSMGATAASGGLMVSMAGWRIFANAATLTGSIGVRMDIPQLQGLMGKLGIGQETLVSGPYKDATSLTKPLNEEDRRYLQELVMKLHSQFVEIIALGRNLPKDKVLSLANGKVYTGQEALELGLVDAIGGQEEALKWLAEETGVPTGQPLLKRKVSKTRLMERLLESSAATNIVQSLQWLLANFGAISRDTAENAASKPLIHYQM